MLTAATVKEQNTDVTHLEELDPSESLKEMSNAVHELNASRNDDAAWTDRFRMKSKEADRLLHREPCMRQSLLYGIGTGLTMGVISYYRRRTSIFVISFLSHADDSERLAIFEFCRGHVRLDFRSLLVRFVLSCSSILIYLGVDRPFCIKRRIENVKHGQQFKDVLKQSSNISELERQLQDPDNRTQFYSNPSSDKSPDNQ